MIQSRKYPVLEYPAGYPTSHPALAPKLTTPTLTIIPLYNVIILSVINNFEDVIMVKSNLNDHVIITICIFAELQNLFNVKEAICSCIYTFVSSIFGIPVELVC